MNFIQENLRKIHSRIQTSCITANRDIEEVKLLLATKTVSAENIKIALESGEYIIGENKAQEIKSKYDKLKDFPHQKHFIGHLQTNKIKDILKYDVTCIQSIDRKDLAEKLHKRLLFEKKSIDVFIQVNTSNEESKFGVAPNNAIDLVKYISDYNNIRIKGLMTIGLFSAESERVRDCFKMLKEIQAHVISLNIPNVDVKELSMGMSHDLEIAIEEGATILRIGTAIFGKRKYSDSYYWNENTKRL